MSRTPSMSTSDAETALGLRGTLRVTPENRALMKKWLSAKGVKSVITRKMNYQDMSGAYNDITDQCIKVLISEGKDLVEDEATEIDDGETLAGPSGKPLTNGHNGGPPLAPAPQVQIVNDGSPWAVMAASIAPYIGEAVRDQVMREVESKIGAIPALRIEVARANGEVHQVEGYHHPKFAILLKAATSRNPDGHVPGIFIQGEASSGKTYGAKTLSKALGLPWHFNGAISFPHEMLGFIDAAGNYHRTPFREAYENGGVYVFDEVDRSDGVALLAVNPHLANGIATFPDKQIQRHHDCIIIGTANTWGLGASSDYSGATKLDAAFMSRFPVRISWDIDTAMEIAISGNEKWARRVIAARERARGAGLKVTIDTRMTQAGAALIQAGFTMDEAATFTYLANLKQEQRLIVEGMGN
jgi:hypothetical protein